MVKSLAGLISLTILALGISVVAVAATGPQAMTLQGSVLTPSGAPLEATNVTFTVQVRSTADNCLIYQESLVINMSGSEGIFSFPLGSSSGTRPSGVAGTTSLTQAFNNSAPAFTGVTCDNGATSYAPASGDKRKIFMSFDDGGGSGPHTISQGLDVQSVPYALAADSLQGHSSTDFIQTNILTAALSQANLELVFASAANVTKLIDLMGQTTYTGSSTEFTGSVAFDNAPTTTASSTTFTSTSLVTKNYSDSYIGGKVVSGLSTLAAGDSGKVLSWNGTQWVASAASSSQWTTTGSNIYYNTGKVGIGTSNPSGPLDVQALAPRLLMRDTNDNASDTSSMGEIGFTNSSGYASYASIGVVRQTAMLDDNTSMIFRTSGVLNGYGLNQERMRIAYTGNVGIGTTNPASLLTVNGKGTFGPVPSGLNSMSGNLVAAGLTGQGSSSVAATTPGLAQGEVAGLALFSTFQTTGDNGPRRAADVTAGFKGGAWGAEYLAFGVGYGGSANDNAYVTNEQMRILANGRVGIGTTAPGAVLEVAGDMRFSGNSTAIRAGRTGTGDTTGRFDISANSGANDGANITLYGSAYTGRTGQLDLISGTNGKISIQNYDGASFNQLVSVMPSGRMAVGSAAPRAALDVSSGALVAKAAVVNSTTTIDTSTGNTQYTNSSCGSFEFDNMVDGGSYLFVVKGTSPATCTFTAFTGVGSGTLTVHMPPDNGATTSGKHTLFNLTVVGSDVYVAWTPGY